VNAEQLAALERSIYNSLIERAYGWDWHENFAGPFVGNRYEIKWSPEDGAKVFGGVVTHNHPRPSFPVPSLDDLRFMHNHNLKQMRVVAPDPYKWHKVCHRVATRTVTNFPAFDVAQYTEIVSGVLRGHRIPYYVDQWGVHPREIIKASIDAMDEALQAVGTKWGFTYQMWTD
jgi:hypothetical protein